MAGLFKKLQVGVAALLITQEGKRVELVLQRSHKRETQSQINKFQPVALVQEDLPYNQESPPIPGLQLSQSLYHGHNSQAQFAYIIMQCIHCRHS